MRKIIILILIVLTSCKQEEKIPDASYFFIIEEKIKMDSYMVKSTKGDVETISEEQFFKWNIGDTLLIGVVRDGFYKGETYLIQ